MTPFQQALMWRAFLGFILVETPVLTAYLSATPTPDWKVLLAGLLGAGAGALEKYVAPSVFNLPAATTVSPVASALGAPPAEQPHS